MVAMTDGVAAVISGWALLPILPLRQFYDLFGVSIDTPDLRITTVYSAVEDRDFHIRSGVLLKKGLKFPCEFI
jgi:hypothetical protein